MFFNAHSGQARAGRYLQLHNSHSIPAHTPRWSQWAQHTAGTTRCAACGTASSDASAPVCVCVSKTTSKQPAVRLAATPLQASLCVWRRRAHCDNATAPVFAKAAAPHPFFHPSCPSLVFHKHNNPPVLPGTAGTCQAGSRRQRTAPQGPSCGTALVR